MPPSVPTEISLSLFGGMDESLVATDLPEGLSPAANDVAFQPGSVKTRPCLSRIFAAPFAGSPSVVWGKKYIQANGVPLNLYLDALGVLRWEDPAAAPGVGNLLQQLSPAVKTFKSVTFDGVEYMAFSDGVHGVEVPRFYDTSLGVFDRISKDGVGKTAMAVADVNTQVNVNSVTFASLGGGVTAAVETGNSVLITTAGAHGLTEVGGFVLLAGIVVAGYNGVYQIDSIPSATTFIVTNAGTGLGAAGAGGTVSLATITVVTATPHGLNVGDAVVLAGTGSSFDNGTNQTSNIPVPAFWDVVQVTNPTTYLFSLVGLRGQGSLNTTTIVGSGVAGTSQTGGMIPVGTHQVAVSFLWRGDYITRPSQPVFWTCSGNKQATITNIPTGPTGVIARILHFTGAGGGNFFSIPTNIILPGNSLLFNGGLAPSTIVNSTWILDNTTTTFTADFPDNALFSGLAADIPGNNLFDLVVLGPCLGFDAYASRLMPWGAFNKIENFWNMGFEGGITSGLPNQPLGWGTFGAGFALVNAPNGFGLAGQITGTGGAGVGTLTQSAYQNYLFQPIIQPNVQYSFYTLAKCSAAGLAGNLVAKLSSASTGFSATASIPINTIPSGTPIFLNAQFTAKTPAVIPSDFTLSIYEDNLNNGATVTYDENMIVFTSQPYKDRLFTPSYVNNPESFDGLTGNLGSTEDPNPIRDTFQILNAFWYLTSKRLHSTIDAGVEPGAANGGWTVNQREDNVGAPSIHSATAGTGWAAWLADTGKSLAVRAFSGGDSGKISREMLVTFKSVNMASKSRAWACNVDDDSKIYFGIPTGEGSVMSMPVLDYFYADTAGEIIANRPLHIGLGGKMLTTDLGRKWNNWKLPLAFGAVLARPNGIDRFCVGSGATATGTTFGNVYTFEDTKLTDDDYGQMFPKYTTYFFVNHEIEQQAQLGSKRKLFGGGGDKKLVLSVSGLGQLIITPWVNVQANKWVPVDPLAPWVLTPGQTDDIELDLDIDARRVAFEVSVIPAQGATSPTDVQFVLSHMTVPIMRHPVSPTAGRNQSYA